LASTLAFRKLGTLEHFHTFAALLKKNLSIMPKSKTHSGAKKRFKVTGSGKIKRFKARTSHLMRKKSKKAKLQLRHATTVSKADEGRIKKLLCL